MNTRGKVVLSPMLFLITDWMKYPFVTEILKRICPKIGASLLVEPEYWFAGRITFKNGKHQFFRGGSLNINGIWAVDIIKDKAYTKYFLTQFWYKTAPWQTFFSEELNKNIIIKRTIDDGYFFAQSLWFPVILKPNSSSQWELVTKVHNKREYYSTAKKILKKWVLLVEKFCGWYKDYRIVVLDNEIISVYERIPLSVVWDGISSIQVLLSLKQEYFYAIWRNETIEINDFRLIHNLKRKEKNLSSIPKKGEKIMLLDNANLSSWWDAIDFTDTIDPFFWNLSIQATKDMWLRLCWVDILTQDITKWNEDYIILELNGSPGLDNYASLWKEQQERVDNLYVKILQALEKSA